MSIFGTYFTSWAPSSEFFQLGPIVIISAAGVWVDGIQMNGAIVTDIQASWSSASGNPSSGLMDFMMSPTFQALTFTGAYWLAESDEPQGPNIYGYATLPGQPLSAFNGTYYAYAGTDQDPQPAGQLVLNSPAIAFNGTTINNPVWTGLNANGTDTNELAWFTSGGNDFNAAISFFDSTSNPGVLLFNGNVWQAGSRPVGPAASTNNFFGTTQSESDAGAINQIAQMAQDVEQAAVHQAVQWVANEGAGEGDNEGGDAGDAGDDAGDAADAGDDAGDVLVDVLEDVGEGLLDVLAALAVEETPDQDKPVDTPTSEKQPSGMSAKQLLALKDKKPQS